MNSKIKFTVNMQTTIETSLSLTGPSVFEFQRLSDIRIQLEMYYSQINRIHIILISNVYWQRELIIIIIILHTRVRDFHTARFFLHTYTHQSESEVVDTLQKIIFSTIEKRRLPAIYLFIFL